MANDPSSFYEPLFLIGLFSSSSFSTTKWSLLKEGMFLFGFFLEELKPGIFGPVIVISISFC
jgi:hypothetical protein